MTETIGLADAQQGNWNRAMGMAYQHGLEDGKARKRNAKHIFTFEACYQQGYDHGIAQPTEARTATR